MKNILNYIDTPNIREICDRYGHHLQHLNYAQRYELIGCLGWWLYAVETAANDDDEIEWNDAIDVEPDDDVRVILYLCDELSPNQVLNFIAGIAAQGAEP
jgi:hypothetical protein